ncbi:STAS domain-containing protein [Streptomyces buecherae]|uniref:STAS domain-containing protein n=1 Tax=Streptomyces buecherae TaxID=2763006 RepID=UPI00364ED261
MRQWHSEFQARCWYDDANTVVELHGEIDIVAAEALAPRLRRLIAAAGGEVIVDLRPVSFIDCSGLGLLCSLHERLMARGRRLRVLATRPVTLKMLRLTGLHHAFVVHGSLREARSATGLPLSSPPPQAGHGPGGAGRAALGAAIASVIPSYHRTRPRPDAPAAPSPHDG